MTIPHAETPLDHDAGTRAEYWEHLYNELRAQVQKLEEENNRLDEKIFLLDQENKLYAAEVAGLKSIIKIQKSTISLID
tara:strand:+ start:40 stop:276 length:237 start_codon:yes stop_codon:yes gene_type:complete